MDTMENSKTLDVLAMLQAKFDSLPRGTVLVPPTKDDDSDVTDADDYYGFCPTCQKRDGYVIDGGFMYFLCKTHRLFWLGQTGCGHVARKDEEAYQESIGWDKAAYLEGVGWDPQGYTEVEPYHIEDELDDVQFGDAKPMYGPEDICKVCGTAPCNVDITDRLVSSSSESIEGRITEIQSFVEREIRNLSDLLNTNSPLVKPEPAATPPCSNALQILDPHGPGSGRGFSCLLRLRPFGALLATALPPPMPHAHTSAHADLGAKGPGGGVADATLRSPAKNPTRAFIDVGTKLDSTKSVFEFSDVGNFLLQILEFWATLRISDLERTDRLRNAKAFSEIDSAEPNSITTSQAE